MAKIIDITGKLTNEKPVIKVTEDFEFEVNASKNAVIRMQSVVREGMSDVELMDESLKILIGEVNFERLNDMNLSIADYKTVYIAVMACVNNESFEDASARFH